jgi:hypothetical protein
LLSFGSILRTTHCAAASDTASAIAVRDPGRQRRAVARALRRIQARGQHPHEPGREHAVDEARAMIGRRGPPARA